jgi:phosphoribosylanthranilate isomerase
MSSALIKVCGMRDSGNIAEVCAAKPDFIGLIFVAESPRCASGVVTRATLVDVPRETKKIGIFRDEEIDVVLEHVSELGLDGVQLHGSEDERYTATLKKRNPSVFVLQAFEAATVADIESLTPREGVDMFVLDSGKGGTGTSFDWQILQSYRAHVPFLLAGGVSVANVSEALELRQRVPQLRGIDINSKVEISPGVKSIEMVREVIKKVRGV